MWWGRLVLERYTFAEWHRGEGKPGAALSFRWVATLLRKTVYTFLRVALIGAAASSALAAPVSALPGPRTPPPNGTGARPEDRPANAPTAKLAATIVHAADTAETVIVHGNLICSQAGSDGARNLSFACLNAALVREEVPPLQVPGLKARDAVSRDNPEALGTFSYAATAIRMGANFGKSVYPERPNTPSYSNSIVRGK